MEIILVLIILLMIVNSLSPLFLSVFLLLLSTLTALSIHKLHSSSWLSLILILIFSSGMMLMFFYASSLAPNDLSKPPKLKLILGLTSIIMLNLPKENFNLTTPMKNFSSGVFLMVLGLILISCLLVITNQTFNPNLPLNSTF